MTNSMVAYKLPDEKSDLVGNIEANDNICVISFGEWSHVHWKRGQSFDGWVQGLSVYSQATPY